MEERLQKILAQAGHGSRRACEDLIREGLVRVNGAAVTRPGCRADPGRDRITVDGVEVALEKKVYLVFNKPPGYLCTSKDRRGRKTILDLLPGIQQRVYTVGRLDADSEGLLIITNDGEFAQGIAHPRSKVDKTYQVWIRGGLPRGARKRLERGIWIEGKKTLPARVHAVRPERGGTRVTIRISEGRKRQLKKMFSGVGSKVDRLRRVAIGGLRLGNLAPGNCRSYTRKQIEKMIASVPPRRGIKAPSRRAATGLILLLLLWPFPAASATDPVKFPRPGTVTTDRVNIRAGRSLNYEIMKKLDSGDRVTVLGIEGGWYRIVPPDGVSLWVSRRYISGGKVSCGRLNVRANPTLRSTVLCQIRRGDDVEVIEESGDWTAIKAPGNAGLWVSSELIDLTPGREAVARVTRVEETVKLEIPEAEEEFPKLEEQLRPCAYEGKLVRVEAVTLPGALHKLNKGAFFWKRTECLLTSDSINIDYFVGDKVGVWGHEVGRMPSGMPVVNVKRIEVR